MLPALQAYADWVAISRWSQATPHQLYWNNGYGNGMDNLPNGPGPGGDGTGYGSADMSSQMVLMWRCLAELYAATGDRERASDNGQLAAATAERVNRWLWHEADGRYHEVNPAGQQLRIDTIAGFWTLISGIASPDRAARLAAALADPQRYWTDMVFPALSRNQPAFDSTGFYWRGGVWAPTTYATVTGLQAAGHADFARAASERYLSGLSEVLGYTGTLWETYAPLRQTGAWITGSRTGRKTGSLSPVVAPGNTLTPSHLYFAPASDEDGPAANGSGGTDNIVKPDFVGWSGLGPIAMLIENVIGITADTPNRTITWRLTRTDRNGVQELPLGSLGTISLVADARGSQDQPARLCVSGTVSAPLALKVVDHQGRTKTVTLPARPNRCFVV